MAAVLLSACRCAAASSGCMPELVSLSPCMDYLSGNVTTPDGPCCSALSGMLRSSPGCLCTVVLGATPASLGVAVDGARVTQLPAACKVQATPASQCNATGVATPSPATPGTTAPGPGGPAAASPSDYGATPAGSGSKATPASTLPSSDSDGSTTGRPGTAFVLAAAALTFLQRF
ncbi:hypothetical protein HU200_058513 [Digitaria exilis]|uniref:Bifunctional inhibitor/plant lipid transfer protein/seed storage helical domain-containing protein n=1 Tax=Digitaria exilis TaxID=1010633 RepID=A0A835E3A5_9POAL|nr:hypothetical protein HU200_058513 [Digitaria exilis]